MMILIDLPHNRRRYDVERAIWTVLPQELGERLKGDCRVVKPDLYDFKVRVESAVPELCCLIWIHVTERNLHITVFPTVYNSWLSREIISKVVEEETRAYRLVVPLSETKVS